MLKSFPKIYAMGTRYVEDIFESPVEITEKVDGSQFVFGVIDGEFRCRSKNKEIHFEAPDKMFEKAVEVSWDLYKSGLLDDGAAYYCEYLQKPKHNALAYGRVPKNHLVLYGVSSVGDGNPGSRDFYNWDDIESVAEELGIDPIPFIHFGMLTPAEVLEMLDRESYLGEQKIEGVVVKNYDKKLLMGSEPTSLMSAKYVSEAFKEVNKENWKAGSTSSKWEVFKDGYRTDARWAKAVQHLRDEGSLEGVPRDIGQLIKAIQSDITEECEEEVKDFLWKQFRGELLRSSTRGFPEWYKQQLALGELR